MEKEKQFGEWYDKVLSEANILDDRYPVKGFTVYRGWGHRIVRGFSRMLEEKLEAVGHEPMLFPVVIPEESFGKESEHIKGFESEVFWITKGGADELPRKLLLRPTSETAIYPLFKYWIRSHADLPLKMHQTCTIYRYETKATRPLLRAREFLWNEAHTAHDSSEDAERQVREGAEIYRQVYERLALHYILLKRPDFDKFHGAVYSIAFDAWNPDGKVNQIGTVHNLGDKFAKAFELTYEDDRGEQRFVYQTCYGFGMGRVLAALVAQHGDDRGLILPPEISPIQAIIVPIPYRGYEEKLRLYCMEICEHLNSNGVRAEVDDNEKLRPGEKFYHWEMMGVPIRIEIGPREADGRAVTLVRRDSLQRSSCSFQDLLRNAGALMEDIMGNLSSRSERVMGESIVEAKLLHEIQKGLDMRKIVRVNWCGDQDCALRIKEEIGGEIRGTRFDVEEKPEGSCVACGKEAREVVYVARTY